MHSRGAFFLFGAALPLGLFAGGLTRRLPRWLMLFGLAIGVLGELSSLSLLSNGAALLLPLTRFPGLLWLIGVGLCLPRAREREPAIVAESARAPG